MVFPVPGAPYSRMPLAVCSRWLLYALPMLRFCRGLISERFCAAHDSVAVSSALNEAKSPNQSAHSQHRRLGLVCALR